MERVRCYFILAVIFSRDNTLVMTYVGRDVALRKAPLGDLIPNHEGSLGVFSEGSYSRRPREILTKTPQVRSQESSHFPLNSEITRDL